MQVSTGEAFPGVRVWFAPPDAADSLDPSQFDAVEREEYQQVRRAARRRDWLSSRALLRAAAPGDRESRSLSHSGGYAGLGIAPRETRLGVDLECLAPRDFVSLADIAYAPEEAGWLARLEDGPGRCAAFYELWTLKEAFVKALRLPLLDGLRACRFVDARGNWNGAVPSPEPWQATVFAPRPDVRLAVVAPARPGQPACYEWPGRRVEWPVVRQLHVADSGASAC